MMNDLRWPPPKKPIANTDEAPLRFLSDAPSAAKALSISERTFHSLRKRSDFPQDATVVFGPRCVRFRISVLLEFAASLATERLNEPKQLQESRTR